MSQALGRVVLVGAGPGHPGLLTLRGARALAGADVVLYDELASEELLGHAPPSAELVNVGKRGHEAPPRSQEEINALLVERAKAGQRVVRLKGGDPYVFGRGGEEAAACAEAGVPFEVIPGVSSAIAAPAFAGIPVTDRRGSASFAVVTGHKDPTKVARETRWGELARSVDTLVILMGMRTLPALVERILAGGLAPDTPAAAVMAGTRPEQEVVVSTLAALPEAVRRRGLRAPAAIVIGEVVGLRETLSWWESAPLFGSRVLVTRAPEAAREQVAALHAAGARVERMPLVAFEPPEPDDARRLAGALGQGPEVVVFASANAVRFTLDAAREAGLDLGAPDGPLLACVGPRTAEALLARGLPVHTVASGEGGGGAEALVAVLQRALSLAGRRVLVPRSQLARDTLADGLRRAGARVEAVTAYRTLRPPADGARLTRLLEDRALDAITLSSPSAVAHLLDLLGPEGLERARSRCTLAAIGATTAAALERAGWTPQVVPERPDGVALVDALEQHWRGGGPRPGSA